MSLEERLAQFRKEHGGDELREPLIKRKSVSPEPCQEPTTSTNSPKRTREIPLRHNMHSQSPIVEDTLYNDFKQTSKTQISLILISWSAMFYACIRAEFGAIFFIISIFYLLFKFGLRSRKPHEVSAYSVFNPGVQAIGGSELANQQLERMGIRQPGL